MKKKLLFILIMVVFLQLFSAEEIQNHNQVFAELKDEYRLVSYFLNSKQTTYYKKLNTYLSVDLLILDELGFKKIPNHNGDDLFEIISKRYERGSIILTTNKFFEQWSEIIGDSILSGAILDRIVHHSEVIKITGPS